jgi:hypothetical protein
MGLLDTSTYGVDMKNEHLRNPETGETVGKLVDIL